MTRKRYRNDHGESVVPEWDREEVYGSEETVGEDTYEEFSELYRGGKGYSGQTLFRDIMAEALRTGSKITAEQVMQCLAEMDLE